MRRRAKRSDSSTAPILSTERAVRRNLPYLVATPAFASLAATSSLVIFPRSILRENSGLLRSLGPEAPAPSLDEPSGEAVFDREAGERIGREFQGLPFRDRSPEHGVDEVGGAPPLLLLDVADRLLYDVVDGLAHKEGLVEAHPEEIADILFRAFSDKMAEDPVEVELPPYDAGSDLVDKGLVPRRDCRRREVPVDRLVQKAPFFDIPDYPDAERSDGAEAIFYAPYPPVVLSSLPSGDGC
jgi:hypothetical protein